LSTKLALEARDEFWEDQQKKTGNQKAKPLVAGSVGCYGASLANGSEYIGNYADQMTQKDFKDFHR